MATDRSQIDEILTVGTKEKEKENEKENENEKEKDIYTPFGRGDRYKISHLTGSFFGCRGFGSEAVGQWGKARPEGAKVFCKFMLSMVGECGIISDNKNYEVELL